MFSAAVWVPNRAFKKEAHAVTPTGKSKFVDHILPSVMKIGMQTNEAMTNIFGHYNQPLVTPKTDAGVRWGIRKKIEAPGPSLECNFFKDLFLENFLLICTESIVTKFLVIISLH